MKKPLRTFISLIAAAILLVSFAAPAFAAGADYTFNAPDWLTENGTDTWSADDGSNINVTSKANTDNFYITDMSSSELSDYITKNVEDYETEINSDAESRGYTVSNFAMSSGEKTKIAGYDTFKYVVTFTLSSGQITVPVTAVQYLFTSKANVIYVTASTYDRTYTASQLEEAIDSGFVINEEMPSAANKVVSDAKVSASSANSDSNGTFFFGISAFIVVVAVVVFYVLKKRIDKKKKKLNQNDTYYSTPGADYIQNPEAGYGQPQYPQQTAQPQYPQQTAQPQYPQQTAQPQYPQQTAQPQYQNTYAEQKAPAASPISINPTHQPGVCRRCNNQVPEIYEITIVKDGRTGKSQMCLDCTRKFVASYKRKNNLG